MALIKCPDCGKMFSEYAEHCPECGCPIANAKVTDTSNKRSMNPTRVHPHIYISKIRSRICISKIKNKISVSKIKNKAWLWGAILLLCIGCYYAYDMLFDGKNAVVKLTPEFTERVRKYDHVYSFYEGWALVELDGKTGLINTEGKEVVPCEYDFVRSFVEGLAAVFIGDYLYFNGKWGFINKKGKEVIPCEYDGIGNFSEGLAAVALDGKWGFINKKGEEVVPCKYDGADSFSEGMAKVKRNGKYGFINTKGKEIVPCKYDEVGEHYYSYEEEKSAFSEGMAKVKRNGKWGFINKNGKEIVPCEYDYAGSFSEGMAKVQLDGKWGFINKNGKEIVPCKYDEIDDFSEGMAKVQLDGKYGFINTKGKVVIPCKYDNAFSFSEGMAAVKRNSKWGVINTKGEVVIPCKYGEIDDFSEGMARVQLDGKWGVIDMKGKEIVPCKYDEVGKHYYYYEIGKHYYYYKEEKTVFYEGMARVMLDGKYGFVNTKGEEVIPCKFDDTEAFSNGVARVGLSYVGNDSEMRWGYVDKFGNTTFSQSDFDKHSAYVAKHEKEEKERVILDRARYIFENLPDHMDLEEVDKTVFTPSFLEVLEKAFALDREFGGWDMEAVAYWYTGQDGGDDDGLVGMSVSSSNDKKATINVIYRNWKEESHTMKLKYHDGQWLCDDWDNMKAILQKDVKSMNQNIRTEHYRMEGDIVNEYDQVFPCKLNYEAILYGSSVHKIQNAVFKDLSEGGVSVSMEGEEYDGGERTLHFWGYEEGVSYTIKISEMRRDGGNYFGSLTIGNKQLSIRLWVRN